MPGLRQRLEEAQRLGFTHAIVPRKSTGTEKEVVPEGMRIREVGSLTEALSLVLDGGQAGAGEPSG